MADGTAHPHLRVVKPDDFDNPANPHSRGFDTTAPEFIAARDEAHGDPLTAEFFGKAMQAATLRWRVWCDEYARRGGGGLQRVGDDMDPFVRPRPADMLAEAKRKAARRVAYQQSPRGRLGQRLAEAESAGERMQLALSELRSAVDRDDGSAPGRAQALEDATTAAFSAVVLVRQAAELVARSVPQPTLADDGMFALACMLTGAR